MIIDIPGMCILHWKDCDVMLGATSLQQLNLWWMWSDLYARCVRLFSVGVSES